MQKFLSELQRRNVLRVTAAYVVAGWVILQIAVTLETTLSLPAWFDTIVFSFLAVGFPIALVASWFFEFTSEGIKRTTPSTDVARFKPQITDIALAAALVLVFGAAVVQLATPPAAVTTAIATGAEPSVSPASIAVLPFADLSPAGDQAYFSDGIAEEILNVLAHTEGLKVASRTSAFQYRKNTLGIPAIAKALNVRHILEGSVRRAGDTVRITAQLIDAQTDAHLWSQTFDRPLTTATIFAIQDEIAKAIVGQLANSIGGTAAPRAALKSDTDNLDAYDLYLKGRDLFINRNEARLAEAARILKQAIAKDAKFARAWEMLAAAYAVSTGWGLTQERDYRALSMEAADKALSLNPGLSMPYAVRGFVQQDLIPQGGTADWEESFSNYSQSIARDPKNTTAMLWRGIGYMQLGYFELANTDLKTCLEIDPAYEICRRFMATVHVHAGRIDEGLRDYEQGLEKVYLNKEPLFAAVYAARGNRAAARALLVLAYSRQPQWVRPIFRSLVDPTFSEADRKQAIALLDATNARDGADMDARFFLRDYAGIPTAKDQNSLWWFRFDPLFLKSEARKKLIRQWRLPDYWRKHGFPPQCKPVGKDDFECN